MCVKMRFRTIIMPSQEHHKKAIQRDTWNLLLDFANTVNADLSNYDPDGMCVRTCGYPSSANPVCTSPIATGVQICLIVLCRGFAYYIGIHT